MTWWNLSSWNLVDGNELLDQIFSLKEPSFCRDIWYIVVSVLLWTVCKERNVVVFQDKELNLVLLSYMVMRESFLFSQINDYVLANLKTLFKIDPIAATKKKNILSLRNKVCYHT